MSIRYLEMKKSMKKSISLITLTSFLGFVMHQKNVISVIGMKFYFADFFIRNHLTIKT